MAEIAKKAKTPAKPRKTATQKTAAKPGPAEVNASPEQVALLAHRFWIERGQKHGKHEDDWYRAEQELRGKAS